MTKWVDAKDYIHDLTGGKYKLFRFISAFIAVIVLFAAAGLLEPA